jgi:3-hydroxy-9,10-secoandrosta-1,3,5(10)-triene-9,17-dione monooxygenase reductase component
VTIHASDPFATPDDQRSLVRRLRGRLPSPVTLWTAGADRDRTGLTVSSVLIVDGDPGRVLGIIGDEADLWAAVQATRRFALIQLDPDDRQVADRFAGLLPAPGGPFRVGEWEQTDYGPVPVDRTWAGCRFDDARPYGWGLLVEASIEAITFAPAADVLSHLGGRYRNIPLD